MTAIRLPASWRPRTYQRPSWEAMERGCKRAVEVWHRRAGKDSMGLHWATVAALQRPGIYWHMLPTIAQARKVVWDGRTKEGKPMLDAWPDVLVSHRRNDEMKLELANGSIWQCVGSDNYDSLVGSNPVGVVFSEYSLADPAAWEFLRPILAENGGWAMFLFTPRGRNHAWDLYNMAKDNPDWHASKLTVEDTGAIPMSVIEEERAAGMSPEMIQQEFFCSFEAPLHGAYYAEQMLKAEKDGRISSVPHDTAVKVETWWDLGIGDATAIWFTQRVGKEVHVIDYHEGSGEGLAYYVKVLQDKPYIYGQHALPHDVRARELGTGKTRQETLKELGLSIDIVPDHRVDDRIEASRNLINKCWFDKDKCTRGIEALRQYRKQLAPESMWQSPTHPEFRPRPVHDWASHGADAFGYGAMFTPLEHNWKPLNYDNRGIR